MICILQSLHYPNNAQRIRLHSAQHTRHTSHSMPP